MSKYRIAQASAWLNLLGAFLVFVSFQGTSTDLLMVRTADGRTAFCVGPVSMFIMGPGNGLVMGTACPQGANTKPTAVVNTDAPWLAYLGWGMILFGFFLQLLSIEKPMLSADDLRTLRKARKIIDSTQ